MNRILFERHELQTDGTVLLADARAAHIRTVLQAGVGKTLQLGMVDGSAGTGRVLETGKDAVRLAVTLDTQTPAPWLDLILAVPRPKVLKRLWAQLAALGVGRIVLINAARVEREYFATHWIEENHYRPLLLEGLAQAGTTRLPVVTVERRFRPYVEDRLEAEFPGGSRIIAHPGSAEASRSSALHVDGTGRWRGELREPSVLAQKASRSSALQNAETLLAIGPEGGWTPFEIELLEQRGFARFSLGNRTLRTDTACIALIAVLGFLREG